MGRYIAIGIPVEIKASDREGYGDFGELKPEIRKNIEKYIDMDYYNVKEDDDKIYYSLKDVDIVNSQLTELLNEIKSICDLKNYFLYCFKNEKDVDDIDIKDDIKEEDFKFELKFFDENYKFKDKYEEDKFKNDYGIVSKDSIKELDYPYEASFWMIYDNENVRARDVKIQVGYVLLAYDCNKFISEGESYLLWLLNTLSKSYFKSKLAKNLHFYLMG